MSSKISPKISAIHTSLETPETCPVLTSQEILLGPPVSPEERISLYSPEDFERFIKEWAFHYLQNKAGKYTQVGRFGGAGDKGRDVICYIGPPSDKKLDIFQCKHYDKPLAPSDIWIELGKLCFYTYSDTYARPQQYRFVAPRDAGHSLGLLFEEPKRLRSQLIEVWKANPFTKIIKGQKIMLHGPLEKYVKEFDFSIVGLKPIHEIVEEFRQTLRYPARFGGGLLRPFPPTLTPPDEIADHEQRYVEQLIEAYCDDAKMTEMSVASLTAPYGPHFARARENYFCAETLRTYAKDQQWEGYKYEDLQEHIFDGVIDTVESDHKSGFERIKKTMELAISMRDCDHPLRPFLSNKSKHGICHQLANGNRLIWVPK